MDADASAALTRAAGARNADTKAATEESPFNLATLTVQDSLLSRVSRPRERLRRLSAALIQLATQASSKDALDLTLRVLRALRV